MNETELATRAERLPGTYAQRVGDEITVLRSLAQAGEWAELLDDLTAALAANGATVTTAEREEVAALLGAVDLPTDTLERLTVDDQPSR